MSDHIKQFGIIGFPLSHSFSPGYFTAKFQREGLPFCRYDAFPLSSIELLPKLLAEHPNLQGLNVTIPYKTAVLPYLNQLSDEAQSIGAVNVINIKNGQLTGYNSDVYGFEKSLRSFLPNPVPHGLKALVLGNGGAARAVHFALRAMGISFQKVTRNDSADCMVYENISAEILHAHHLIINTTPLGMSPDINTCPSIPYEWLTDEHYCYDLVYNPEKTLFLARAESNGAHIQNGLSMLHLQAERAWEIWQS